MHKGPKLDKDDDSPSWVTVDVHTGKEPRTRCRSTHSGWRSLPPISIQWAVIVKYSFMDLECHRSQVKAVSFFQESSFFSLLTAAV